jgi:hypothetical protein
MATREAPGAVAMRTFSSLHQDLAVALENDTNTNLWMFH